MQHANCIESTKPSADRTLDLNHGDGTTVMLMKHIVIQILNPFVSAPRFILSPQFFCLALVYVHKPEILILSLEVILQVIECPRLTPRLSRLVRRAVSIRFE